MPCRPDAKSIAEPNAGILLIGPLRTNFCEILSEIRTFSFKKMHLILLSAQWQQICLGLNVLKQGRLMRNVCVIDLGRKLVHVMAYLEQALIKTMLTHSELNHRNNLGQLLH